MNLSISPKLKLKSNVTKTIIKARLPSKLLVLDFSKFAYYIIYIAPFTFTITLILIN